MKGKSSTLYILFILLGISIAIVGIFLGCDQNKQVNPPVLGPAAGSGPVGGGETQAVTIQKRLAAIQKAMDAAPKTMQWKLRAKVGTRVRWYQEVEEVRR